MRSYRCESYFAATVVLIILFAVNVAQADPWPKHVGRLSAMKQKIVNAEGDIKHMLERKRATDDEKQVQALLQEITEKHKTLAEAVQNYEEERLHIRFKHPDREAAAERQYARYHVKSIKDLESEMGIDGRLDRLKSRVLATFPFPPDAKKEKRENANSLRHPASHEGDGDEDTPERIKLVK